MRWLIVLTTFLLSVLLYVDRICISVAKDKITDDLSFSDTQMGWVFSAFSLGYALFQTPSGWLSDRIGPRRVLTLIVTAWSFFTGLTAVAGNYLTMLLVRFFFGAAEAGAFPGMARATFSWFPMKERGRVQAINFSGSRIGAAVTLPGLSVLILNVGWQNTFLILMGIGLVWSVVWYYVFRDDPSDAQWLSEQEKQLIASQRQSQVTEETLNQTKTSSFELLLQSKTLWALCVQYFASNFTFFFALTWFFPTLKSRYALEGIEASLFAAIPLIGGAIGCWLAGLWIDALYDNNRQNPNRWRASRRFPAIVGFACSAIGMIGSAYAVSAVASSLWFTLCIFGADMTLPPSWSTCVDIGKQNAGVVSGTMNMAGNIGSFLTALAFPYLVAWTGSELPYFFVAALLSLTAIGSWFFVDPTKSIHAISPMQESS